MASYKHDWTLDLPRLDAPSYQGRNLCVQMQRSAEGDYRATLLDLHKFRGSGSTHVASEIRRAITLEGRSEGRI